MRLSIAAHRRRTQRGAALLLTMLLVVMAGAVLLLDGFSSAARTRSDAGARTSRALADAKAALVAYALSDANRPGELPCPDINRDGESLLPEYSGNNCTSLRGWLPWITLDLVESRDGSGAALWYSVSDNFHANDAGALNPDTAGGVVVDGGAPGDVVAVIIAPGEPLANQTRPGVAPDAAAHVGAYLEGVNADGNPASYVSTGAVNFNDRLIFITAEELLRATERRVVGEVAAALTGYRQANAVDAFGNPVPNGGSYPWLSPFADPFGPATTLYDGVPGTRIGHVPHIDGADVGEAQDTAYTISWTEGDATVSTVGADSLIDGFSMSTITPADLVVMQLAVLNSIAAGTFTFPTPSVPTGGNPSCVWQGNETVADCTGTVVADNAGYLITVTMPSLGITIPVQVSRDYTFDVSYTGTVVTGPHSGGDGHRVRSVDSGGTFAAYPTATTVSTITVRDYVAALPGISVTRTLTIVHGSTATVDVDNIYLEPSAIDNYVGDLPTYVGDLPSWFFTQQWDRFVLVEYADNALPGESLATAGTACAPGPACVNLDIRNAAGAVGATRNDLYAVVVGAGRAIPGMQTRAFGSTLADFFEQSNAVDGDGLAERRVFTSAVQFNDQVRIVEPAPLP